MILFGLRFLLFFTQREPQSSSSAQSKHPKKLPPTPTRAKSIPLGSNGRGRLVWKWSLFLKSFALCAPSLLLGQWRGRKSRCFIFCGSRKCVPSYRPLRRIKNDDYLVPNVLEPNFVGKTMSQEESLDSSEETLFGKPMKSGYQAHYVTVHR